MSERVITEHRRTICDDYVDITVAVIGRATGNDEFTNSKRVPGGNITFDPEILEDLGITIVPHDQLKISVEDENNIVTHVFTFLITERRTDTDEETWEVQSLKRLPKVRKANNVFLAKTDIEMFKLLVDEYFPEFFFDDDSIPPDLTLPFSNQRFTNKKIADIFDTFAENLQRYWFIDKNFKIHLIERKFTSTGYVIDNAKVAGSLIRVKRDITRWQTVVTVEGQAERRTVFEDFTIASISEIEFTLQRASPAIGKVTLIPVGQKEDDGTVFDGILLGAEDDVDNPADFTYSQVEKKIRLSDTAPSRNVGDIFRVYFQLVSKITSTQSNAPAFQKYGRIQGEPIVNRLITTQDQADVLAQDLADVRGEPVLIYDFPTVWDPNILAGNAVCLNVPEQNVVTGEVNVLSFRMDWGDSAPVFSISCNDYSLSAEDTLDDLFFRLRQLEEKVNLEDSVVTKEDIIFANFEMFNHRFKISSQSYGNAFRFDSEDVAGWFDNVNIFLDGNNGSGGLIENGLVEVSNYKKKVKFFLDDIDEIDTINTTATVDVSNRLATFSGSQVLRTQTLHYLPGESISKVRLNSAGGVPDPSVRYLFDGDVLDQTCNYFHGVATNITFSNGIIGQAADFELDNMSSIQFPEGSDLMRINDSWTVSLWFNPESIDSGAGDPNTILNFLFDSSNSVLIFTLDNTTDLLIARRDSGGSFATIHTINSINTGTWHNLVVTYDGSDFRIYLNSNLEATVASTFNGFEEEPTFAGSFDGTKDYYDGLLDMLYLYEGFVLSQEEVNLTYNAGSGLESGRPVAFTFDVRTGDGITFGSFETLNLGQIKELSNKEEQLQFRITSSNNTVQGTDGKGSLQPIEVEIIEVI